MNTFTQNQKEQIIKMYNDQIDIDTIINTFEFNEHDIRFILKENQIDRKYNAFTDELYQRIIYLYDKLKYTKKRICYDLLVSEHGIDKTLSRNGISKRSYSENNRRYYRNQHYFDNIDTPNKAYILGLLYSDGCNNTNHNSITLSLQEDDVDILKKVKEEIEYAGDIRLVPLHSKNNNYKDQYVLCINDEYMSKQLETLGVINAKSLILKFPDYLRDDLIRHFVRGYFDGDGCIYIYPNKSKCTTSVVGTVDFCNTLSSILSSFGYKNSIYHPNQCKPETVVLRTGGNKSSYQFLSWLYEDAEMKMKRKYQKYIDFCESYLAA